MFRTDVVVADDVGDEERIDRRSRVFPDRQRPFLVWLPLRCIRKDEDQKREDAYD